ncbi:SusC/RagA family TonB-linked outer membrane protein [Tenacibaculum xiamenense]|uniref:SusC/RagA family TonB-linked outer membrane protein n=1 Tax=Tenacibaculum xiamenense TaxID=1261553 RepID=UPI003892E72F
MRKKILLLWMLFVGITQLTFAQSGNISGTVVEKGAGPLPGVSILVKGTQRGTETDFDGKYIIKANKGDVLQFTYMGFASVEKTVGSTSTIDVTMTEDANMLNEVVVVAFGTTTKEEFTGSASIVGAEDLATRVATSPIAAIEGKATGVQFLSGSGAPGSSPSVVIRGVGTLNGSTDPLYIVDGIQFEGGLSLLNQDDIESMTVLKDAASTSLYGSRAANGVIIITTKSGKKGRLQVNASTQYGIITRAIDTYETVGAGNYYELMWEAYKNSLTVANPEQVAAETIYNRLGYNPFNVPNDQIVGVDGRLNPNARIKYQSLDWFKELERTGSRVNHSLSIAGGGENHKVFFSSSYLEEKGYVIESNFERITNRLNADFDVADWLKVGGNVGMTLTKSSGPGSTGTSIANPFNWIQDLAPIYPVYLEDSNGNFVLDSNGQRQYDLGEGHPDLNLGTRPYNPGRHGIAELILDDVSRKRNNLSFRQYAEVKLLEGLTAKVTYGQDIQDYIFKNYDNHIVGDGQPTGRLREDRTRRTVENFNQILTFDRKFDLHKFNVVLGHESFDRHFTQLDGRANTQTATGIYEFANFSAGDNVDGFSTDRRLEGYFGRLNYSFDDRYYLSGSFRRDGTSVFSSDVRWGNFFSLGGSWRIDQENFMSDVSFINNLKLRASYGEVGNDDLNNFYIYQALYEIIPNAGNPGIFWASTGNEQLTWENQVSWDVALDFGLFDNTLEGSVEFYRKTSKDLLFNKPIPFSEGLNEAPQNVGDIYNQGLEVSLTGHFFKQNEFNWDVTIQASTFKNEITALDSPVTNGTKRWEVGRSRYDYFIHHYAGVDPDNGDALYYMFEEDLDSGQMVPVKNDDGSHKTTNDFQAANRAFTGDSSIPDLIGSVQNRLSYKGFGLDFLITFGIGGKALDNGYSNLMSSTGYGNALHVDANNAWRNPGDITDVPRLEIGNPNQTVWNSTRFLTDASYWTLRNVNLSYDLDAELTDKLGVNRLRLFMSGENLFVSAKRRGMNPQQTLSGVQSGNTFNPNRVVSFGVNLAF